MKRISFILLMLGVAAFLAACGAPAGNTGANTANAGNTANANAAKPTAAAPTKETLMTMEKAGWEAWKNRDAKWTVENASDKYVGFGATGRMDKAASIKSFTQQKCEIKSYEISDDQMRMVGPDVAVLTFKGAQDYTCDGKKGPANVQSASIYFREGDEWKSAFYAENPIIDPKNPPKTAAKPPAKPVDKKEDPKKDEAKPDAVTEAMLTAEKALWEAWKAGDAKKLEDMTAKDVSFINIFGTYFANKADTMKSWTGGAECEIKSVSLTDAAGTMVSPTVGMLTFKGNTDGTCGGQKVGATWGVAVYVKDGDVWKYAFGMNSPA